MRRLPKNLAVERTRRPEPPIASVSGCLWPCQSTHYSV